MTETKWLTVDEASLLCQEMGLNRTKKTVRDWARKKHVAATKQTTSHGEMWVLDKSELTAKIKAELEFAAQERTRADAFEPVRTDVHASEPVRTGANPSEPVRSKGEKPNENHESSGNRDTIRSLKTQIEALKVDVGWRDKMLDKLTRENETMLENMHGQARYIGHLESDVLRLGGEPDMQFLTAPKVQSQKNSEPANDNSLSAELLDQSDRPHPEQQSFISG